MLSNVMRTGQQGVSIIELMIAVAIMGILLALGLPSFKDYLANVKVRSMAEAYLAGLQNARGEAVKRNGGVEFLVTGDNPTADNAGATYATVDAGTWVVSSKNWMTRISSPATFIEGKVSQEGSGGNDPVQVQIWADANRNNSPDAGESPVAGVIFGGFGSAVFKPTLLTTTNGPAVFRFTNPAAGACAQSGGPIRCLQIVVSTGGQVRMCDPAVTAAGDTRAC